MSGFSKLSAFKQKFTEVFDKDAKTQDDPEFEARVKEISNNEKKIK